VKLLQEAHQPRGDYHFGDLSYGVFLFHHPILQMLNIELDVTNAVALMTSTLLLSILFALGSWHFGEKPILDRKRGILTSVSAQEARCAQIVSCRRAEGKTMAAESLSRARPDGGAPLSGAGSA
jgi:peptidoglycan/LPS O-acetylase OafA/YrhL